jgi:hypothetical protein
MKPEVLNTSHPVSISVSIAIVISVTVSPVYIYKKQNKTRTEKFIVHEVCQNKPLLWQQIEGQAYKSLSD